MVRVKKPKLGRPSLTGTPMQRVQVSISMETKREAKKLGKGNLSLGLRKAVEIATIGWADAGRNYSEHCGAAVVK